jgi:hypothetical protein
MPHDVFISYSSKNKAVADAVCATMEQRKIRCWIAPRDVPPGQSYAASLVSAIAESRVLVLILSEDANRSVHVLREVGEAVDNGVPVVPLRIEAVEPSKEMRYYIKSIHWLDAMSPPVERHLEKLTHSVQALLGVEETRREASVPIEESGTSVGRRRFPKWAIGLIAFALVGLLGVFLLYPELSAPDEASENAPATVAASEGVVVDTSPPADVDNSPSAALPTSDPNTALSDWKAIKFVIPGDGLWHAEEGRYTAIGANDTIAWSQDIFAGDVEISMDLESPVSYSAANIILYGNGGSLTPGNLIFSIASDQQAISADSIYEGGGGRFLSSSLSRLDFGEQKHSVLISIIDRRASLFLDGAEIESAFLSEEINRSGKIGLLKYWEINEITFSNIHVRSLEPVE